MDMRSGKILSEDEAKEAMKKIYENPSNPNNEVEKIATPIPAILEKRDSGPIVRLSPEEYNQLEKIPDNVRPKWLAFQRFLKSGKPSSMKIREIFYAGYDSAVKFHK